MTVPLHGSKLIFDKGGYLSDRQLPKKSLCY